MLFIDAEYLPPTRTRTQIEPHSAVNQQAVRKC